MPLITGRKSSLPAAKSVRLMALTNVDAGMSTPVAPSKAGLCGNSSPFAPVSLYLPASLDNSTACVAESTLKVSGMSGNALRMSNNILAGIAMAPVSSVRTSSLVDMVVSKSDAVTTSSPGARSNKKWSKMGNVLLLLKTPPRAWRWRSSWLLETMKCISSKLMVCEDGPECCGWTRISCVNFPHFVPSQSPREPNQHAG